METFNNVEEKPVALEVTENSKMYLKTAASWSKFMAILQFVAMGLIIFAALVALTVGSFMGSYTSVPLPAIGLCYLAIGVIMFFPAKYLYCFAQKTAKAVAINDTLEMEKAFKNMKSFWKFTGIMTIVILALSISVIPIIVIAAAAGAFV